MFERHKRDKNLACIALGLMGVRQGILRLITMKSQAVILIRIEQWAEGDHWLIYDFDA